MHSQEQSTSDRSRVGSRLSEVRRYLGFELEEVAKILGIQVVELERIELGESGVRDNLLLKLTKIYQHTAKYFTDESGDDEYLPEDILYLENQTPSMSDEDRTQLRRFARYLKALADYKAS